MVKILKVKPFRQTPGYCGPASVKMVLRYYNIHAEEKEIARHARSSRSHGTSLQDLKRATKHYGFMLKVQDNSSLRNIQTYLDKDIPVIIDWFSQDDGHYSVAVGIDKRYVYLQDPELGALRKIEKAVFLRVWFDFKGRVIGSKKDMILRRMIILKKMK